MKNLTGTSNVWVNALVITVLTFIFIGLIIVCSQLGHAEQFSYNL